MRFKYLYDLCYLILFFCSFLISCKKYPEDGIYSLQTAKKRLRAHSWHLNKLYINTADSTMQHLHNILPNSTNLSDFYFTVSDGMNYKSNGGKLSIPFNNYPPNASGYDLNVSLLQKKTELKIDAGFINNHPNTSLIPGTMNSVFWIPERAIWEITKLTKNDLHIRSNYNNYDVIFEFKK